MAQDSVYGGLYDKIRQSNVVSKIDYCIFLLDRMSAILSISDNERFISVNNKIKNILSNTPNSEKAEDIIALTRQDNCAPEGGFDDGPSLEYYIGCYFETAWSLAKFIRTQHDDEFIDFCDLYETMVLSVAKNVGAEIEEMDTEEVTAHFTSGRSENEVFKKFSEVLRSGHVK